MAPTQHQRSRNNASRASEGSNKAKKRKRSYKNQIRDVQRLLRQKDIPATIRVTQERMLDMLKDSLTETAKQQKEKKMTKKYKMVKFFEKRKITRMYKSCTSEIAQCTDQQQRDELENRLKLLKQQWNYVMYFPKDEKYISLFPPTPCTNQPVRQHQDEIFKLINDKITDKELDDSSDMILMSPRDKTKRKTSTKGIRLSLKQEKKDDAEDDDELPAANSTEVDDFFIDTTPSEIVSSTLQDDKEADENALNKGSSSNKGKAPHCKVKRLKDERDFAAAKKNKKNKKNRE